MHDPCTVAHKIKAPWKRPWVKTNPASGSHRPTLITIWHVDPEADGSDDSCGWSRPKLTKVQRERMKNLAFHEAREPWFLAAYEKKISDPANAESLCRGAILLVARSLRIRISFDEASVLAADLIHNSFDHLRGSLCLIPGYHTNDKTDTEYGREQRATHLFCCIARILLAARRHWWQHPRWHFWHWRIQVHPTQKLKRWLFTRCCVCGKRFPWGYAPVSDSWEKDGPRWFRGERGVRHHDCAPACTPASS
jgi:hypothetical protein